MPPPFLSLLSPSFLMDHFLSLFFLSPSRTVLTTPLGLKKASLSMLSQWCWLLWASCSPTSCTETPSRTAVRLYSVNASRPKLRRWILKHNQRALRDTKCGLLSKRLHFLRKALVTKSVHLYNARTINLSVFLIWFSEVEINERTTDIGWRLLSSFSFHSSEQRRKLKFLCTSAVWVVEICVWKW